MTTKREQPNDGGAIELRTHMCGNGIALATSRGTRMEAIEHDALAAHAYQRAVGEQIAAHVACIDNMTFTEAEKQPHRDAWYHLMEVQRHSATYLKEWTQP